MSLWPSHSCNRLGSWPATIERDHTGQPKHDEKGALSLETRERPKLLEDLPPEARKLVEDVVPDGKGRLIPRLYNKMNANRELRAFLNLGQKSSERDVSQLSDQELLATLAQQARELNIEINFSSYTFAQQPKEPDK
jgi:hypothetical protein